MHGKEYEYEYLGDGECIVCSRKSQKVSILHEYLWGWMHVSSLSCLHQYLVEILRVTHDILVVGLSGLLYI